MTNRSRIRRLTYVFVALFVWSISLGVSAQATERSNDLYFGVLPEMREATLDDVQGRLSTYNIDVELNPDNGTISGWEHVRYLNTTGHELTEVAFRLYPNAPYYNEGALTISEAFVDDKKTEIELKVDDTAMVVKLHEPLEPNNRVRFKFRFTTTVPGDSTGTFGVFSWATAHGTWVLADWYPIVAGYERGKGWNLDPPTSNIDPTFSDAALYDVTFAAPKEMVVVATGAEVGQEDYYNHSKRRYLTGPAREFSLVVDDDYVKTYTFVNGTKVSAFANPGNEEASRRALGTAARALESYSTLYGAYPYKELDIVDVPLAGALGVSWTGLIYLDGDQLYEDYRASRSYLDQFDFVVAHEVGHQWWGSIVGANSNDHAFQVEGLTNYLSIGYYEMVYDPSYGYRQLETKVAAPYLAILKEGEDGIADRPMTGDSSTSPTPPLVYGKAALGFLAIREEIGDESFYLALSNYATNYRFRISTPDDLLECFEAASGESLDDLWEFWFQEADTTPEDVEALLEAAPETVPQPPIRVTPFE